MATAFVQPPSALRPQQFLDPSSPPQRRHASKQRFATEFSQCLCDFVVQLLPTTEELAVKEDVRKLLERLIRTIEPDSRLLSFGSTANGFSLRNSDMDLCCLIDSEERLSATDLVTMLGDLLERETKFHVKPLPHARIPIVKLSLDPSPGLPFGIACDIGFENRLALENTRLLMCYAMIDPARVRTMVLFLKVWSKRRKINSPYKGTLSSYGYVLLVIYFLVHVKNPQVLPNLQQMPPVRSIPKEETTLNGHNIWFFDDIELLRQRWKSSNTECVAELLIDFFKFFSRDFTYNSGVVSIRAGLLNKESKGWQSEFEKGSLRERNRLCIEDPFETDFNVARCVTRDGLYTIRGEFMRASRILQHRPDRAIVALAQLCEERKDEELLHASPSRSPFVPPRLYPIPPQIPYTVGSSPMRPTGVPVPAHLSPQEVHAPGPSSPSATNAATPGRDQLGHMAPKRGKWTSPPPPEAPEADHSAFEDRLGQSLALATAAGGARELREAAYASSSNASEVQTDEDIRSDLESDDVHSVHSFVEERQRPRDLTLRGPQCPPVLSPPVQYLFDRAGSGAGQSARAMLAQAQGGGGGGGGGGGLDAKMIARLRGRAPSRLPHRVSETNGESGSRNGVQNLTPPARVDTPRRSLSGPARSSNVFSQLALPTLIPNFPRGFASPTQLQTPPPPTPYLVNMNANTNVYYETTPAKENLFRVAGAYGMPIPLQSLYARYDTAPYNASGSSSRSPSSSPHQPMPSPRHLNLALRRGSKLSAPQTTTETASCSPTTNKFSHSHTHSTATIIAARTPPLPVHQLRTPSRSPHPPPQRHARAQVGLRGLRPASPFASLSSGSGSPPMSCTSSQYAASSSPLSTSPPSPAHSEARVKLPPSAEGEAGGECGPRPAGGGDAGEGPAEGGSGLRCLEERVVVAPQAGGAGERESPETKQDLATEGVAVPESGAP
ncbi:hypothetical protein B0H21DRAFT_690021 [Amylocystis lapponica]|nr:hypothetical protein B0H21DRAFT_690021 [Amylocystis lapponica]